MSDFQFLKNPVSKQLVILAPRRAKRPDMAIAAVPSCPFCIGHENDEPEIFRLPNDENSSLWDVRVIPNKFPFAPNHEIVIHSPDHHKNFDELPVDHVAKIVRVFQQRYNTLQNQGQVYIFHNHGEAGGESLPHPHTQLLTIPFAIKPPMQVVSTRGEEFFETKEFLLLCPSYSQWPDEVWIVPKKRGDIFGQITPAQTDDFAYTLKRVIELLDMRHGHEFPYNFYIYPSNDWYLRIIPRYKTLGGFEIGTTIFVNTQDPKETLNFIKEHFEKPDKEKISSYQRAEYKRNV